MDSFGSMGVAVNPGVSVGTTKPRTPSSVWAQMMATLATDARPIQRFDPLRIQSPPSRCAKVVMPPGSDPAVGSVSPKQPIASPAAIAGSHSAFCSPEPYVGFDFALHEGAHRIAQRTFVRAKEGIKVNQIADIGHSCAFHGCVWGMASEGGPLVLAKGRGTCR